MDFLVVEQTWAIAMVFFVTFILNTCSRWETEEKKLASDPHNSFGEKISDNAKPTRGNIMNIAVTLLCLGGMVLFLMHVKL